MINKIGAILRDQMINKSDTEKAEYLNNLGFKTWEDVKNATEKELQNLYCKLRNETIQTISHKINGSTYIVSQPKGNKDLKRITWSNTEVTRFLNKKYGK